MQNDIPHMWHIEAEQENECSMTTETEKWSLVENLSFGWSESK